MSGSDAAGPLDARFRARLREVGWLDGATGLVVGVSGGLDSMTLLHLVRFCDELQSLQVHAAHVDHRMRAESAADAAWVAEVCAEWGVAHHLCTAPEPVVSEAEGRALRYGFFEEVRTALGGGAVTMTGHTADDQAETVLFRIARGSGPRGLGGVRPERAPSVVRPLLPFWRRELEAYAAENGIPFREDPSNRDLRWTRNRLRHRILPALEDAVPGAAAALVSLAGTSRLESAALDELLDRRIGDLTARAAAPPDAFSLDREALSAVSDPVLTLLLRRVISRLGGEAGRAATAELLRFVRESSSNHHITVQGNVTVEHRLGELRIRRTGGGARRLSEAGRSQRGGAPRDRGPAAVSVGPDSGEGAFARGGREVEVAWGPAPGHGYPFVACFSPGSVRFPLTVRPWEPGDRMTMSYGKKKVKKILLEARIPADRRNGFPVVADAGGTVLWVPGVTEPFPGVRDSPKRKPCCVEIRIDHESRHP